MDTHITEQYSCNNSLIADKDIPKTIANHWVAVLVHMNTEKKVGAMLTNLGFHNYVPTQTEIRQWSDRKKKIERVIIPMIVFVLVDKEEENKLRKFSFIHKFVSYPGQKEAAKIPNEQIDRLKYMLKHADSAVEFSDCAYEIGEEIEIVRGPLKGLYGELCYAEKDKPMIGIYVELLGYSYVNVDVKDVKRRV